MCLFKHCIETTIKAIAKGKVLQILIDLFIRLKPNSLLQHLIAMIVKLSYNGMFSCLCRVLLTVAKMIDYVVEV